MSRVADLTTIRQTSQCSKRRAKERKVCDGNTNPGIVQASSRGRHLRLFPKSLVSVGKTNNDGNVSIFTKTGVTVHKEEDVMITCKGAPIMIGKRDERGRYRISLMQHRGQWQSGQPSKKARKALREDNSVYDLLSIDQSIKWMHIVCGYPV